MTNPTLLLALQNSGTILCDIDHSAVITLCIKFFGIVNGGNENKILLIKKLRILEYLNFQTSDTSVQYHTVFYC